MSAVGRHFASRASDSYQPGAFGRAAAEDGGGLGHGFDGFDPVFRDAVQTPRERLLSRDHDPLRDEGLAYADELAAAQRRRLRQELPGNDPHLRLPLRNLRRRGPGVGRTAQRVPPSSAGPTLDP
jgi:acetyl esterase/lipase